MAHYTRKSGKHYSRFAFLICAGCYAELGVEGQSIYTLCERDCGTIGGCERCLDHEEEQSDPRDLNYAVLAIQPD